MREREPVVFSKRDNDLRRVEHWDHPAPPPGKACAAGTVHVITSGHPKYTLGGLIGLAINERLGRQRLAELLELPVDQIELLSLGVAGSTARAVRTVGFSFTIGADSRWGFARLTYDAGVWRCCLVDHPPVRPGVCKCSVRIAPVPLSEVLSTAADMIKNRAVGQGG